MRNNNNTRRTGKTLWMELAILLIVLLVTAWYVDQLDQEASGFTEIGRMIGTAEQVRAQLQLLGEKSSSYLEQAPRNYDDYFRDTKVIHTIMLQEVSSIDNAIRERLAASPAAARANEQPGRLFLPEASRNHLLQTWTQFSRDLEDQLGVDPEMPRLEWGYRHINSEIGQVMGAVDQALESLNTELEAATGLKGNSGLLMLSILAWCLLMLIWFGMRVTR